ncbi:MAG: type II toxin-antitoxin system VapC family toxin [Methylobacterium frigidaeris]
MIADPHHEILVSAVSLWEIVIKIRIGKLDAHLQQVLAASPHQEFHLPGVEPHHLDGLLGLPLHHRDPFDHLLIAQAIVEGAGFVSEDRNAALYPVSLIACSGHAPLSS